MPIRLNGTTNGKYMMIQYTAGLLLVFMISTSSVFAQLMLSELYSKDTSAPDGKRFVGVIGGFYGLMYPAGTVNTSDNYLKRERGKYFGAVQGIGYELWPNFILHGGFTLWDGKAAITRHLLMQNMKTEYSIDTCALHIGVMIIHKWFFADAIVYTELPLEKDAESVELNGTYVQTNELKQKHENGGFLGLGVRVPVSDWLDVIMGVYGGGSVVPSIMTTKGDALYLLNVALRIGVIVYVPNKEEKAI